MISYLQTTITREKLKQRQYLPDKVMLLKEEPLNYEASKGYHNPAVNLLGKIYKEL